MTEYRTTITRVPGNPLLLVVESSRPDDTPPLRDPRDSRTRGDKVLGTEPSWRLRDLPRTLSQIHRAARQEITDSQRGRDLRQDILEAQAPAPLARRTGVLLHPDRVLADTVLQEVAETSTEQMNQQIHRVRRVIGWSNAMTNLTTLVTLGTLLWMSTGHLLRHPRAVLVLLTLAAALAVVSWVLFGLVRIVLEDARARLEVMPEEVLQHLAPITLATTDHPEELDPHTCEALTTMAVRRAENEHPIDIQQALDSFVRARINQRQRRQDAEDREQLKQAERIRIASTSLGTRLAQQTPWSTTSSTKPSRP